MQTKAALNYLRVSKSATVYIDYKQSVTPKTIARNIQKGYVYQQYINAWPEFHANWCGQANMGKRAEKKAKHGRHWERYQVQCQICGTMV